MTTAPGIAGNLEPEVEGNFVCQGRFTVGFFVGSALSAHPAGMTATMWE